MTSITRDRVPVLNETTIAPSEADAQSSSKFPLPPPVELPDQPLVVIEPHGSRFRRDVRELWAYRELLYFLTWRDVKVRYKQTALGAAWAVLQPLATMLIFSIFFGKLANIPSDDVPYPLFAYAGLLPWTYFANSLTASGNSLIGNSHLLTKIYFPRVMIPAAAVVAGLVDLGIAFIVLVGLMFYYDVAPTWNILMLPVLVLLLVLGALGAGMLTSALNVKYRDIRHALPFIVQLWMFASPIIYPSSFLGSEWQWVLSLNPLTGIIEGFRAALFGHKNFDWFSLSISATLVCGLLAYATYVFRRMERHFADIV